MRQGNVTKGEQGKGKGEARLKASRGRQRARLGPAEQRGSGQRKDWAGAFTRSLYHTCDGQGQRSLVAAQCGSIRGGPSARPTCCRVQKPTKWDAIAGSFTDSMMASLGRLTPLAAAAAAASAAAALSCSEAGCQAGGPCGWCACVLVWQGAAGVLRAGGDDKQAAASVG